MPLLFSYGTLQQENVQLATFGRQLQGRPDELPGFTLLSIEIKNPDVVATSGLRHHRIARRTGRDSDRVPGMVFELSDAELASADQYEDPAYTRVEVTLGSGRRAWVYVEASMPASST